MMNVSFTLKNEIKAFLIIEVIKVINQNLLSFLNANNSKYFEECFIVKKYHITK